MEIVILKFPRSLQHLVNFPLLTFKGRHVVGMEVYGNHVYIKLNALAFHVQHDRFVNLYILGCMIAPLTILSCM